VPRNETARAVAYGNGQQGRGKMIAVRNVKCPGLKM
jgi:hypothetical protein